jgi:DNA-binding MarR family transcriptional regulator
MTGKEIGLSEAQSCLGFALRKADRSATRRFDAALRSSGLKSTQFNLLVFLDAVGTATTSTLADGMAIDRTTLTRNLALLVKNGWIRTEPGADRRSRNFSITHRGRRLALNALPAWRNAQAGLAAILGKKPFEELRDQLAKLTNQRDWSD